MTQAFCSGCNRLRLTADGKLKNCLFGRDEFSVLEVLRDPLILGMEEMDPALMRELRTAGLRGELLRCLEAKHWKYGGAADMDELREREGQNRPMVAIGG